MIKELLKKALILVLLTLTLTVSTGAVTVFADNHEEEPATPTLEGEDSALEGLTDVQARLSTSSKAVQEKGLQTATALIAAEQVVNKLFWPMITMIGGLMDNSLIFEGGMEDQLRAIWVPIRNIVNILFIIGLVVIALYNVLGLGDENDEYSLKAMLPKIIIAIIAINFSFTAVKVILETSETLTTSVLSLPRQISEDTGKVLDQETDGEAIKRFCALAKGTKYSEEKKKDVETIKFENKLQIYTMLASKKRYLGEGGVTGNSPDEIENQIKTEKGESTREAFAKEVKMFSDGAICTPDLKLTDEGQRFFDKFSGQNAALAMAINMGKVVFYTDLPVKGLADVEAVIVNTVFSILLYMVYVVTFILLFLVLLGRAIVIWVGLALSPVIILLMVASNIRDKFGSLGELSTKFLNHVFVPLKVSIVMSVGWIMLKAIQKFNTTAVAETVGLTSQGFPVVGLSSLQDIIVAVGTIGIVWMGVKAATDDTIMKFATEKVASFAEDAARWIGKLPLIHLPGISVKIPGEETPYDASMPEVFEAVSQAVKPKTASGLAQKLGLYDNGVGPDPFAGKTDRTSFIDTLRPLNTTATLNTDNVRKSLKGWMDRHGTQLNATDSTLKDHVNEMLNATDNAGRNAAATKIINEMRTNPQYEVEVEDEPAAQTTALKGAIAAITPANTNAANISSTLREEVVRINGENPTAEIEPMRTLLQQSIGAEDYARLDETEVTRILTEIIDARSTT